MQVQTICDSGCCARCWFNNDTHVYMHVHSQERERLLLIESQRAVPDNHWGDQNQQHTENSATKL